MKWRKLGRLLEPSGAPEWRVTHAAVPTTLVRDGGVRIYFSGRDRANRSRTGWVDLELEGSIRLGEVAPDPVLDIGELGRFDDSGSMASWALDVGERVFLYYIGWNLGVTVPFRNATGLAISEDGGNTFRKFAPGPVLDRSLFEPYFATNPCVLHDGATFRMWYLSCVGWEHSEGRLRHRYHLRHAESQDGVVWARGGLPCIDFQSADEYAISRPSVIRDGGLYRMWYSHRGPSYRIGYAESLDGRAWIRKDDEAGIDVAETGWDSEMIEYPCVFDFGGARYMLYNGNGYGRTGFGLAVLEKD